jgi:hypothetical protein
MGEVSTIGLKVNYGHAQLSPSIFFQELGDATPARTHGQAAVWIAANSVGSLLHADAHPPG